MVAEVAQFVSEKSKVGRDARGPGFGSAAILRMNGRRASTARTGFGCSTFRRRSVERTGGCFATLGLGETEARGVDFGVGEGGEGDGEGFAEGVARGVGVGFGIGFGRGVGLGVGVGETSRRNVPAASCAVREASGKSAATTTAKSMEIFLNRRGEKGVFCGSVMRTLSRSIRFRIPRMRWRASAFRVADHGGIFSHK